MDLDMVDERTKQELIDISEDFDEDIDDLIMKLDMMREHLSDEEIRLLSYIIVNRLSNEMENYINGFVEMEKR